MRRLGIIGILALAFCANTNAQVWPIAPIDRPHGVYGTFANPNMAYDSTRVHSRAYIERDIRGSFIGYHVGIDIPVNDAVETRGTAVYSMRQGTVEFYGGVGTTPSDECSVNRMEITHGTGGFIYGHISSAVAVGQTVEVGQIIGYTCVGTWHLHLGEYVNVGEAIQYINPLVSLPHEDTAPPRIGNLNTKVWDGVQNVSVLTDDPQSLKDWDTAPQSNLHVHKLRVKLIRNERVLSDRLLFTLDKAPPSKMRQHFDIYRSSRNMRLPHCAVAPPGTNCNGAYWLRLWKYGLDTRNMDNGIYTLSVIATDLSGNTTVEKFGIRIAN